MGETKKKTKQYVEPSINSPVLNKTASLLLDAKTITSVQNQMEQLNKMRKYKNHFRRLGSIMWKILQKQLTTQKIFNLHWSNAGIIQQQQKKNISANHHLLLKWMKHFTFARVVNTEIKNGAFVCMWYLR